MRIYVDSDSAPSIHLIENLASTYHVPVTLVFDLSHEIESDYSETVCVSKGFQSADMYLFNHIKKGDIVIPQDYGVITVALARQCACLSFTGDLYTSENIDSLLLRRHITSKLRRGRHHIKGPRKRIKEDDIRLEKTLEKLIIEGMNQ